MAGLIRTDSVSVSVIEDRDASERKPDDREARSGSSSERDDEGFVERPEGTRCGANVRPNRDLHADESGQRREGRAEREGTRGLQAEFNRVGMSADGSLSKNCRREDHRKDRGDNRDRLVLAPQERSGPLLDCGRDLTHPLRARFSPEDVARQDARETEPREDRDRDDEGEIDLRDGVHSSAVSAAASSSTYLGFDGSLRRRTSRRGSRRSAGPSSRPSRGVDPGRRGPCSARRN